MKKETYIEIVSVLLILLFVYTGTSKIINFDSVVRNLHKQPLPQFIVPAIAILLPAIELIIAFLLMAPQLRKSGLFASLFLMTLFTLYVGYILFVLPHSKIPCSCGGIIKQMSWRQHLVFNIAYTLLALSAILVNKNNPSTDRQYRQTANLA